MAQFQSPPQLKSSAYSFRRYIAYWPLFIISLLLALGGALLYLRYVKPVYQLKSTIAIQDENTVPRKSTLQELDLVAVPKVTETEIEILKSRNLIRQAVDELALNVTYELKTDLLTRELYQDTPIKLVLQRPFTAPDARTLRLRLVSDTAFQLEEDGTTGRTYPLGANIDSDFGTWQLLPTASYKQYVRAVIKVVLRDPEKVTDQYQKGLEAIMLSKKAPTVSLTLNETSPERGKALLNYLTQAYNTTATTERNQVSQSTISFIDERLNLLTKELNNYEQQVEQFRSQRGLTDISSQSQLYLENVQATANQLNEVNVQLNVIGGLEKYLLANQANERMPSTIGITDPGLNSLVEKLAELQLQRERLLATTPANNPLFEPVNRQLELTRKAILDNVRSIKTSLLNTRKQLQSYNTGISGTIRRMPGQERQLGNIKRQQAIKENLYTYLLQKREELSLKYASTTGDVRVVDTAFVAGIVWPKKPLVLALALLFGLGAPLAFMVLREYKKNGITSRQEIEQKLHLPILAELNYCSKQEPGLLKSQPASLMAEQFRTLRTSLRGLPGNSSLGRVIMVTSSVANEGKTFVSSNLAASLAAAGRKTIFCEFDLRCPGTWAFTTSSGTPQPGLSELLAGTTTLHEAIQHSTDYETLHFMDSGALPADPSTLLESPVVATILQQLREQYDDVILDTPPVHLVADARILAAYSDFILYVVRQGVTAAEELDFIQRLATEQDFQNIQLIFNGINKAKHGYGYQYDKRYYRQSA